MQPNDVGAIVAYLQRLYGDRFAPLTNEMAVLWLEKLSAFPLDHAKQAVKRWAADHLPHQAPSLTQIAEQIEVVQTEQRRQQGPVVRQGWQDPTQDPEPGLLKEEVHALIASVWPDHGLDQMPLLKDDEVDVKRLQLRHQARQLRMQAPGEDL